MDGIPSFVYVLRKYGAARFSVPYSDTKRVTWFLKGMPQVKNVVFTKIDSEANPKLPQSIRQFEINSTVRNFKFGVLYLKPGQTTEDQIYGNQDTGDLFKQFLNVLGNVIPLKGHKGFRGLLSTFFLHFFRCNFFYTIYHKMKGDST